MPSTFHTHAVAAGLAGRGWPVMPCHHPVDDGCSCGHADCASPGKHPRTRHGLQQATTDSGTIRRWWRRWPEANVAVRTGARPDGAGVVVIDIDPAHGGDIALAALEAEHGAPADHARGQHRGRWSAPVVHAPRPHRPEQRRPTRRRHRRARRRRLRPRVPQPSPQRRPLPLAARAPWLRCPVGS